MKKQTFRLAVLAVAGFGWISLAAAQEPGGARQRHPGGPGGPGGPGFGLGGPGGPPVEMIAEHLGLSDEQKTQWKAIHEKSREEGQPLMKAAGGAREAFDKALESDNPDAAVVGQAAIAMRAAQRSVEAHQKATLEEVKAILTPEQLAKVEDMEKRVRRPGPDGAGGQPGFGGPGGRRSKGPASSK